MRLSASGSQFTPGKPTGCDRNVRGNFLFSLRTFTTAKYTSRGQGSWYQWFDRLPSKKTTPAVFSQPNRRAKISSTLGYPASPQPQLLSRRVLGRPCFLANSPYHILNVRSCVLCHYFPETPWQRHAEFYHPDARRLSFPVALAPDLEREWQVKEGVKNVPSESMA